MQLTAKPGVRYTGGRYEFTVRIVDGSIREPGFAIALENIAADITKKSCSINEMDLQESFGFDVCYSEIAKQYALKEGHNRLARFAFYRTICPALFRVKIRCDRNLGKKGYDTVDAVVKGLLGDFERIPAYGPEEHKRNLSRKYPTQPKSQPCQSEQPDLFQLG